MEKIVFALAALGAAALPARADDAPIQDNSFLVEEAYNQERGVVQHIQVMELDLASRDWAYAFTEEWPAPDQQHQVAVTVPVSGVGGDTGLGDVTFNYRRELLHSAGGGLVVTPSVSVWLPSGDAMRGFGEGVAGVDVTACVTIAPHPAVVLHTNVGMSAPLREDATTSLGLGQSVIWLAHARLNLLVEVAAELPGPVVVSPGLRTAIDFRSGLQIVPGVAAPVSFASGERAWGALLYVSFEHSLPVSTYGKEH